MPNKRTAFYSIQLAHGARMVDFHGWDMPVQFAGIIAEHLAVRRQAGIFDLGHMGRLHVAGLDALAFLEQRICRRLSDMAIGQVRYGLILDEAGGIEDDILVSREEEAAFHIVVNASNLKKIKGLWAPTKDVDLTIQDLSDDQAMLALQGPEAAATLARIGLDPDGLRNYRFADRDWQGIPVRLSRTGYTGEDGCECFLPALRAERLWQALAETGAVPCGLGARDLLRLEAGMPLYGHEIDTDHSPLEAGLDFAVDFNHDFTGRNALEAQREAGLTRRLVGLRCPGRRAPRAGYAVLAGERTIGSITSGGWSPILDAAIAMAYVAIDYAIPGRELSIDLRGKTTLPATVVALPFYRRAAAVPITP
jgi:aminomethyltransferase